MRIWKTGDPVRISFREQIVVGTVKLASPNGRSLALEFEAMLGGYVGMIAVFYEEGEFRDLITQSIVLLSDPELS